MSDEKKYTCPHCDEGFDKAVKNHDKESCCPLCEGLLAWSLKDRKFLPAKKVVVEAREYGPAMSEITRSNENPRIYKIIDSNNIREYRNVDYVVRHAGLRAEELYCPRCNKITTKNNVVFGAFEFFCTRPLDPMRHATNSPKKCKTRIRYEFTK